MNNNLVVEIDVVDSCIWNKDEKVIEIVSNLINYNKVIIILGHRSHNQWFIEPMCAKSIGLYDLLDNICNKFPNFIKKNIVIVTKNILEFHTEYTIDSTIAFSNHEKNLESFRRIANTVLMSGFANKDFSNKEFKHFGCFVSRVNWQRLWISSHLLKNYKNISNLIFHFDITNDYHLANLGIEDLIRKTSDKMILKDVVDLINVSPLNVNSTLSYPIGNNDPYFIPEYKNIFVDIVCESAFSGNVFGITEKIKRSILYKTPFIIQGSVNFLKNFKKFGFKTFNDWWPEVYNDSTYLPDHNNIVWSTREIFNVLEMLSRKSTYELQQIYTDMQGVLDHNFNRLISISYCDIHNFKTELLNHKDE